MLQKTFQQIVVEAREFLALLQREGKLEGHFADRLKELQKEILLTGTYKQTSTELAYGAKIAWRHSSRCIGRLHWKELEVRDKRHLTTAEEVFEALVEHLIRATNQGKIRPLITIFAQQEERKEGIRIWNPQLIRYAGYRHPTRGIVGDPSQLELTEVIHRLGWRGGRGTPFDILPLVIQMPSQPPRLFELPPESILEVQLSHPDYQWFEQLGIKWHVLPVISNMSLEVGGVTYTAAPFNGWYMGTEIGARNLGDEKRYNLLPLIAQRMGLDISSNRTMWKDRAIVELNVAVLYSFMKKKVAIVDHHTASRQFMLHEEKEKQIGRPVPTDWGWIVPPISSSTTPVFHRPYQDETLMPNFFSQQNPWQV